MLSEHHSLLRGNDSGSGSFTEPDPDGFYDWCEPFEFHLNSTSMRGWPKMLFEIFSCDSSGRIEIAAYGWCHLPLSSGDCDRTIYLQRPQNGSFVENLHSKFLGSRSRYLTPEVIASTTSRLGHTVDSVGSMSVHFSVAAINFDRAGVLTRSALYGDQALPPAESSHIIEEHEPLSSRSTEHECQAHQLASNLWSPCQRCQTNSSESNSSAE